MSFQDFVAAAEALCPDPATPLAVRVEYTRYSGSSRPELQFSIWDGWLCRHHQGKTAAEALAHYRSAVTPPPPVAEALAAVGEIAEVAL